MTTPLLLLDLLLTGMFTFPYLRNFSSRNLAGLPWPTILITLLIDEVMIVTGLVGALVHSSYKVSHYLHLPSDVVC